MAANQPIYASATAAGTNANSGWSHNLWKSCPWNNLRADRNAGFAEEEDFLTLGYAGSSGSGAVTGQVGKYPCYIYQGGEIVDAAIQGGGVKIDSDGDNEGAAIFPGTTCLQFKSTMKRAWCEFRVKTSTIADTKHGIFLGLTSAYTPTTGVPIATDGTLADKDLIGFHRLEGTGNAFNFVWKASGQTQVTGITTLVTLVADTFVKIGFTFDPDAETAKQMVIFVNGVENATYVTATQMAAATFPNAVTLGPIFAVMNATGTTPGNSTCDWWRYAQEL